MLVKEWIKASIQEAGTESLTEHAEVNRVVDLLAKEEFYLRAAMMINNRFAIQMARHDDQGRQEDAMVVCDNLAEPEVGYVMRDGGNGSVTPPRVPLKEYSKPQP